MTVGKRALQPHDASLESLEEYATKLSKYQSQLAAISIPLPEQVFLGLEAKAKLEDGSYRLHAHEPPEE